ncbi:MAG: hypothetical protein ACAI38_05215 [Myxococcota bacterium]|nr:hypothetical protein [Myxococcota bacterium]
MEIKADGASTVRAAAVAGPNAEAQRVVFGVLSEYFGDAAYLAEYRKRTDGQDVVDLTKLPHVDRGGPGAVVVFHTFKGQVTMQDMYKAIADGQKKAGIPEANRIEATMTVLELPGA